MIEEIADGVDAAETAARAAEASRQAQFTHAMQQAHGDPHEGPHDPPPAASGQHAGGLAGLWDDAVSGVGSAYHWTTGAAHTDSRTRPMTLQARQSTPAPAWCARSPATMWRMSCMAQPKRFAMA